MGKFSDFISIAASGKDEQQLSGMNYYPVEPMPGKILFVDGGNSELIAGPDFSVQYIRAAAVVFDRRKKLKSEITEFYAVFRPEMEKGQLAVKTGLMNVKGTCIPDEKELVFLQSQNRPGFFADIARRITEIGLAIAMLESMDRGSFVVLDGTLEAKSGIEKQKIEALKEKAREKGIGLCALSKTTSLVSSTGNSVPFNLDENGPEGMWYCPVAESEFQLCFAKLHPKSSAVFRCDAMPHAVPEIFSCLAFISDDPVFFGYPYGLIEADRIARVTNREREMLRIELSAKAGKKWATLEKKEKALNAHEILDSLG